MEPQERISFPKRITQRLRGFEGKTVEDKILNLAKQSASANLRECNDRISRFESRYGRAFPDFKLAWERGEVRGNHEYRTEIDFIEWEALEQEKEHWLAEIRHLQVPVSAAQK